MMSKWSEIKPKVHVRYYNMYQEYSSSHPSREKADSYAYNSRIACIRVEFEEGQFDD